jgi:hypothetical protein
MSFRIANNLLFVNLYVYVVGINSRHCDRLLARESFFAFSLKSRAPSWGPTAALRLVTISALVCVAFVSDTPIPLSACTCWLIVLAAP